MTAPTPTTAPRVLVENLQPHDEPGAMLLGTFDALIGRGAVRLRGLQLVQVREEPARVVFPASVEVLDAGLREAVASAAREAWAEAGAPIGGD